VVKPSLDHFDAGSRGHAVKKLSGLTGGRPAIRVADIVPAIIVNIHDAENAVSKTNVAEWSPLRTSQEPRIVEA